ncbi:ATP-binding cassette domain-containing protein, partial [Nostocales cyanobacterium LEGE 12452]|nr:ATP-binding cassette domain-containing protein [Nostocales cyanobacterium LEGE 12452]
LYLLWVIVFLNQRRNLDRKRFEISAQSQSQLIQLIHGMQEIKLAGAEMSKRWDWENTQAKLFKWNIRNLSLSQVQQIGGLFINQGKNILATFLAAKSVVDGDLTLGGMMSVQYMLGQFNSPIEQLIGLIQSWQDAQMSVERLNEIHELNDEESVRNFNRSSWEGCGDIFINRLSYTYPGAGNEPVLLGIDFVIPEGKTTAIVGTSGSGKTTLLKLLLRFYEPQKGRITLGAKTSGECNSTVQETVITTDLKNTSYRKWRQGCGVVMQDGFIFSDSIARNIAVTDEIIDQERLFEAARVANIHDFIQSLPLSYYTKIGVDGTGLSQGQKQRILIARAVYKNPRLLLFDEATNALDSLNESIIVGNLKTFLKGRTVVVVAHRLSTVRDADQIVVLEKGRLIEKGTHTDLLHKKGRYFELINNQLELGTS